LSNNESIWLIKIVSLILKCSLSEYAEKQSKRQSLNPSKNWNGWSQLEVIQNCLKAKQKRPF